MSSITAEKLKSIIEAALMVAGRPLNVAAIQNLFDEEERPAAADIKTAVKELQEQYKEHSGIELNEVSSGYRFQTKSDLSPWLSRLWEERAPRYSRAFLETLAIIAYKQPITRAEIEEIRGVTVNSNIIKALLERDWIRIVGFRDLPGKPAILGTTKVFLDHFNVKSLAELPSLAEFKSLEEQDVQVQLALEQSDVGPSNSDMIPEESAVMEGEEDNIVVLEATETAEEIILENANEEITENETTEEEPLEQAVN